MFKLIRRIHLFAAFILTAFVLMYCVTGFVMVFEDTFKRKDISVTEETRVVTGIAGQTGGRLVSTLQQRIGLRGQYHIRERDGGTQVTFIHPGEEVTAVVTPRADTVRISVRRKNAVSVLHQFHRLHGYHGGWLYILWAFVYDLSAFSMIVFALSGVYLWYRTERTHWPGWLILASFTVFTAFTLIYFAWLE